MSDVVFSFQVAHKFPIVNTERWKFAKGPARLNHLGAGAVRRV